MIISMLDLITPSYSFQGWFIPPEYNWEDKTDTWLQKEVERLKADTQFKEMSPTIWGQAMQSLQIELSRREL